MNLNFISPLYLFGLLGVAVPILIHLLTRRQQKHLLFSAVHLLFQSQKRSIKRSAPNRRLLLLIRCLGIILLSLALANPIFSFGGPGNFLPDTPSASVIILDDSYSMGTRTGQKTFYDSAVEAVLDLTQSLPADSVYSVVLGSAPGRVFQGWTDDPGRAKKILKFTQPSARTTQIGQAFTEALQLLETAPQRDKRIFILTDRDKNGWNEDNFSSIEEGTRYPVEIIDFSGMQSGINLAAVEHVEAHQDFLSNSRVIRVEMRAINLSPTKPINKLKASLWVRDKKQTSGVLDLLAKSTGEKEFSFPLQVNTPLTGEIRIEDDLLAQDNHRFFHYQPNQSIKALIVDGDPKTVEHLSETFYLERALNPFAVSTSNIDPTVSTLAELPMRNLFDYSVVVICNARDLPFGYERELEKFVMHGGALIITLGDQVDPKFYNEKLGRLLPVTLKSIHQITQQDEPFRLLIKPSQHRVLQAFKGRTLEEMKSIRFNSMYSVEPKENAEFTIPMWFLNQAPALIESKSGKGKVILFVSSIDRDWSDFAIQPTFLPWVQRWVKYSARKLDNLTQQELLVGEPFVWKEPATGSSIYIESPGGKILRLRSRGEKVTFDDTFRPGVYTLRRGDSASNGNSESQTIPKLPSGTEPAGAFTVNIDPRESISDKISDKEIRNLLSEMTVTFSTGYQHRESAHPEEGLPLSTPFLLLVGSMLLLEGWLIRKE